MKFSELTAAAERLHSIPLGGRTAGSLSGSYTSWRLSPQSPPEDRRLYTPGDDLRFADWKQYARSRRLTIKTAREPAANHTVFLLDTSVSMLHEREKFNRTAIITFLLMIYHFKKHDRLELQLSGQTFKDPAGIEHRNSKGSRAWLPRNLAGLETLYNRVMALPEKKHSDTRRASLDAAFTASRPKNSRMYVISDLMWPLDEIDQLARKLLGRSIQALFIHTLTEAEMNLTDIPPGARLVDSETGRRYDTMNRRMDTLRAEIRRAVDERRRVLAACGHNYHRLDFSKENLPAVMEVLNR